MTFQWPIMLVGLAALPLLAALYVWALRRPARRSVSYTQVEMLAQALVVSGRWTRHFPGVLVALSLAAVLFSPARPVAPLPEPAVQSTVLLSIDVSRSMLADDLPANRVDAPETA